MESVIKVSKWLAVSGALLLVALHQLPLAVLGARRYAGNWSPEVRGKSP